MIKLHYAVKLATQKKMDDVADLVGEARGKVYFDKFREQIKTFKARETSLMSARMDSLEDTESFVINSSIFGTLFAIIAGVAIAMALPRHIMNLLGGEPSYIAEIAKTVAAGDLTMSLKQTGSAKGIFYEMKNMTDTLREKANLANKIAAGELDQQVTLVSDKDSLALALQEMCNNLNEVLGQTKNASDEISQGSGSVSSSSVILSDGAARQASTLMQRTPIRAVVLLWWPMKSEAWLREVPRQQKKRPSLLLVRLQKLKMAVSSPAKQPKA
jgi:methyl-accepting chemotaxis protein